MSAYLSRDEILGLSAQEIQDYLARGWIDEADVAAWQEWQQSSLESNDPRLAQAEINTFLDTRDRYDMGELKPSPAPQEKLGILGTARESFMSGLEKSAADTGFLARDIDAPLWTTPGLAAFITRGIVPEEREKELLKSSQARLQKIEQDKLQSGGGWGQDAAQDVAGSWTSAFPILGGVLAGGPIGAIAGAAAPAYQATVGAYADARRAGVSPQEAAAYAGGQGVSEYALEAVGGPVKAGKGILGGLLTVAKQAMLEGGTESATGVIQDAHNLAVSKLGTSDVIKDFAEQQLPTSFEDFAERRRREFVAGGLMGGGVRAATIPFERREVEPTGDPAFDAGQIEAKRELDRAAADIPPPSPTPRIPEQQDLFGPPIEDLGSFEEQLAQRQKELEIDAGLSVGRKQTKQEDTDTRIVSTLETNIDRKRQTVEALQERIEAGDTSSATFNTMTKAVKEVQAAEKALDQFKQSRVKKEEAPKQETLKRPQLTEPVQEEMQLMVPGKSLPRPEDVLTKKPKVSKKKPLKRPQLTKTEAPSLETLDLDQLATQVRQQPGAIQEAAPTPARALKTQRNVMGDRDPTEFPDITKVTIKDMKDGYGLYSSEQEKWAAQHGDTAYTLDIPEQNEYIDFDKSVADQDQFIYDKISGDEITTKVLSSLPENATGRDFYFGVAKELGTRNGVEPISPASYKMASEHLASLGVAGNKIFAPLGKRTGKRDFVIFDKSRLKNLGKKDQGPKPVAVKAPVTRGIPLKAMPDGNTEISDTLRTGGTTVDVLLDKIEKNTTDNLNKTIANRLKSLGLKNTVRVIPSKDIPSDVKAQVGEGAKAYYYKGEIVVTEEALADSESDVAWYVQHEATHAASEEVMSRPDNKLTRQQVKAKRDIIDLYNQVKDNPELAGEYGLDSPSEFLAEAHSNKRFQDKLNQVKLKGSPRTVWSKFVESIRNLLGLSKDQDTALSEIIRLGEAVMEAQKAGLPRKTTIEVDGVERPRLNSEGKVIAGSDEDLRNFWRWFGDSKVVDNQGRPLVVYTGTSKDKDFTKFNVPKNGAWFTSDKNEASAYAETNDSQKIITEDYRTFTRVNTAGRVIPVYLNISNPARISEKDMERMRYASNYKKVQGEIFPTLKFQGADGIDFGGGVWVVIGDSNQIKSAIGNLGTFGQRPPTKEEKARGFEGIAAAKTSQPLSIDMVNTPTQRTIGTSERTGITAAVRKLAVNIGRAGGDINPRLREIKETVYGGQEQAGGIEALTMKNRLQDLIDQEGDPSLSKNINAAFKDSENAIPKLNQLLQGKSPALVQEINQIIRDIKLDGIAILREIKKTGTDIDPAVLAKIYRSATDPNYLYTTRSYIINAPRKAGEKYARKVLRAGGLHSRMYLPDVVANAIEGAIAKFSPVRLGMKKEYARRVNAAVDFFLRNDLYIPTEKKDLYRMKTDRIKALHEAHFNKKSYLNKDLAKEYGLDPKDKRAIKKALIDELAVRAKDQTVAAYQEKMKTRAEQMVRDMLKVTDPLTMSKLSKFYAGDRADLTIVTGRENVPKEIRELWGEYEDATFNLFNTRWRQKEFIAKQQMLNEVAGLQGELLFDEPTDIHTDRLTGKTWGPLEGKYVSPDTKYYLDATQEATESISGIVRDIIVNKNLSNFGQRFFASLNSSYTLPLSSTAKLFTVAGNAAGVVMNFAGSPIIAIRDGNFDPKTYAQALKVSKDLIGIVNKKGTYADALEIIRLGLQDSVQTGEISDSEVRSILEATATEGLWADLTKKGHAARMTMVDVFSYSDAWAKIANYYNQKNLLTKVYNEAGVNVPEDTIKREAAERTKRTNLSYLRAPLLAKVPEKTGLLWFTTYTWETFRSTLAGVKMVKDDAARVKQLRAAGKTEAANTLAKANAKRAAGLSIAVPASGFLIQTAVDLAIAGAQAIGLVDAPEDDEEKEKMDFIAEQASYAGTPGALVTPVSKNKDGSMSFFDAARLDPIGPINEMLRGLVRIASGDTTTSTSADVLSNLAIENSFLVNHVVGNYALLTGKPVSPGGAAWAFDKGWQQYKAGAINAFNGLEDKQLDAAYRAWNQVMFPKTVLTGAMAAAEAIAPNAPERPVALQVAAGLGTNIITYDPRESVRKSAQFDFRNEVGPALGNLQDYFGYDYQNINLNVVEDRVLEIAETEFDSWQRVRDKVTAARYAGASDGEIAKALKDSRAMNEFQIASVMSGKFVPYIASPDNIRSWMQAELNSDPNNQKAIQEKYRNLSPALMGLIQKYRTMLTHKE